MHKRRNIFANHFHIALLLTDMLLYMYTILFRHLSHLAAFEKKMFML